MNPYIVVLASGNAVVVLASDRNEAMRLARYWNKIMGMMPTTIKSARKRI